MILLVKMEAVTPPRISGAAASLPADITAVVVTYNSAAIIGDCLAALPPIPCVIVDNASDDDTCAIVARARPDATVVRKTANVGFGRAVNEGFAATKTAYALLLNPDAFCPPESLVGLRRAADAYPDAGLIAPLVLDVREAPALPVMGPGEHNHRPADFAPEGPFCTWFVTAAAWLCPMAAWRAVGGFDPAIFMYSEDVDLCLRMTAARRAMIVAPEARVRHLGGRSSRLTWRTRWRKDWHMTWGHLYLGAKWGDAAVTRAQAWRLVGRHGLKALLYVLLARPRRVLGNLARAHAAAAFLRGRPAWRDRSATA